jgi:hypothetical protein
MEIRNGSLYSFIPKKLEIEERPELNVFSYNVLIAMYRVNKEGKTEMGSVIYEPDLTTYRNYGEIQALSYFNKYNHDYRLDISYNTEEKSYRCDKFKGEENLGIAVGKEWHQFFIHVGIIGLANGETCMFSPG